MPHKNAILVGDKVWDMMRARRRSVIISAPDVGTETHFPARKKRQLGPDMPGSERRWQKFVLRLVLGLVMIFLFIGIIRAGHHAAVFMVIGLQTIVFREVINIAHVPFREKKVPWFRTTIWYFLLSTNYFLYGEVVVRFLQHYLERPGLMAVLVNHHRFISGILYMIGLVAFTLNLRKGHYRFQFGQLALTHMTLILVVASAHFITNNIFDGLFWLVFPAMLVVCNDTSAYIFGTLFGRTPLIRLSPNKTWEGFIGAFLTTLVFAFFLARFLAQFPLLTVPFEGEVNAVFSPQGHALPPVAIRTLSLLGVEKDSIDLYPIQLHGIVLAFFASLLAPFGGFFASGFKRACKIKVALAMLDL